MMLHVVLTETENELYFELKELATTTGFAPSRKIYYRELVARFGYHLAITWNLGEESGWNDATGYATGSSTSQRQAWADYLRQLAYYKDNITVHNGPSNDDTIYAPLLGFGSLTGPEIQWDQGPAVHAKVLEWRNKSHANGHRWVVSLDEPWHSSATPLNEFRNYDVWGSYVAGAGGCELFQTADQQIDDFHPYASLYSAMARARQFIQKSVPFATMDPNDTLITGVTGYALARPGQDYLLYLPTGGNANLNLAGTTGVFDVLWFDPRNGGALQTGTVGSVSGGGTVSIGQPPNTATSDWTALVRLHAQAPRPPSTVRIIK